MQYGLLMMKIIKFIFLSSLIFTLLGCTLATNRLWEHSRYVEEIEQFLISSDKNQFVIIGEKYHYIFDNNPSIPTILNWGGRKLLYAKFYSFELNDKDQISGHLLMKCLCENPSKQDVNWLKKNSFESSEDPKERGIYQREFNIEGTRYLSNGVKFEKESSFNKKYYVTIQEPYSAAGFAVRAAATPITVVSDGVIMISTIGIALVAIPFIVAAE